MSLIQPFFSFIEKWVQCLTTASDYRNCRKRNAKCEEKDTQFQQTSISLAVMLQSIGDHISIMDVDLNIVWANDVAKRRFGNDIIGKKCFEAYHGRSEPCEPSPCLTKKAFEDGKTHEHDTQVIDNEGNTINFHCTANVALTDADGNPTRVVEISRDITCLKKTEAEKDRLIDQLQEAAEKIKTLNRLLPICASCKKIRDDNGYWQQVEEYICEYSGIQFSHSICPACMKKLYPDYDYNGGDGGNCQ
jgi:PAS domain S-box-containing protein